MMTWIGLGLLGWSGAVWLIVRLFQVTRAHRQDVTEVQPGLWVANRSTSVFRQDWNRQDWAREDRRRRLALIQGGRS